MLDESKLGLALKDVALSNINEDIQDICKSLEQITKDIPGEVKKQLLVLNENIDSLSLGLKAVPEQFDEDFSRKINRVLDVASEIENHTAKYQSSLVIELENILSKSADKIRLQLSKDIGNSYIMKDSYLILLSFSIALLSGLVGAGGMAGFLYWMTVT